MEVPQELIETVLKVIEGLEFASGLPYSILEEVAREAIKQDKLNDGSWLEQTLQAKRHQLSQKEALERLTPPKFAISKPADIKNDEDLQIAIKQHKTWMESVLDPGKEVDSGRANFQNQNLSGFSFRGVNLSCADFSSATLVGCDFTSANLQRAKFQQANLQGADFRFTKLKGAKFEGADLNGAIFDGSDFTP